MNMKLRAFLRAFNEMFPGEDAAREWFEKARWPDGPVCSHCRAVGNAIYMPKTKFWHCRACRKQFSVTAGTPMHRTHLPLLTWAQAIFLIVSSSKGISAVKLSELLGVHYVTAWHLGHRIRAMMAEADPLLAGVVEIDEMYAGTPPRKLAKATQSGRVGWWVNLSTMERGGKIAVPLLAYDRHRNRRGRVSNGVLVTEDRETKALAFGVVSDIGQDCEASRAAYRPEREFMALDFGLSTLFAGDDGSLLGKDWLKALHAYDRRITSIARGQQRHGRKPRDSARYRKAVASLRGWIRTEVGRVLNALVAAKRPAAIVLERLNFQNPALSRRLNRMIQNCGRSVIRAKLADFQDRFGITSEEVNPAYTSQTCSCCGYVDKRNRPAQDAFRCLWCGQRMHADVNAARNIGRRRASPIGSVVQSKASVLAELVRLFGERRVRSTRSGGRDSTADPRSTNSYFGGTKPVTARMSKARPLPDLVVG